MAAGECSCADFFNSEHRWCYKSRAPCECGVPGRLVSREEAYGIPEDDPEPPLDPVENFFWLAYHSLGKDANGQPLLSEIYGWLDERKVKEPEERAVIEAAFTGIASAKAEIRARRMEAKQEERESNASG